MLTGKLPNTQDFLWGGTGKCTVVLETEVQCKKSSRPNGNYNYILQLAPGVSPCGHSQKYFQAFCSKAKGQLRFLLCKSFLPSIYPGLENKVSAGVPHKYVDMWIFSVTSTFGDFLHNNSLSSSLQKSIKWKKKTKPKPNKSLQLITLLVLTDGKNKIESRGFSWLCKRVCVCVCVKLT